MWWGLFHRMFSQVTVGNVNSWILFTCFSSKALVLWMLVTVLVSWFTLNFIGMGPFLILLVIQFLHVKIPFESSLYLRKHSHIFLGFSAGKIYQLSSFESITGCIFRKIFIGLFKKLYSILLVMVCLRRMSKSHCSFSKEFTGWHTQARKCRVRHQGETVGRAKNPLFNCKDFSSCL